MIHNLSTVTHAYRAETQSRWNGLIGVLTLEAADPVAIGTLAVFPAPDRCSARVVARLSNTTGQPCLAKARFQFLSLSEAKYRQGALLVCGYDLTNNLEDRPAAPQFCRSLLRYAASDAFRPATELPRDWLEARCHGG